MASGSVSTRFQGRRELEFVFGGRKSREIARGLVLFGEFYVWNRESIWRRDENRSRGRCAPLLQDPYRFGLPSNGEKVHSLQPQKWTATQRSSSSRLGPKITRHLHFRTRRDLRLLHLQTQRILKNQGSTHGQQHILHRRHPMDTRRIPKGQTNCANSLRLPQDRTTLRTTSLHLSSHFKYQCKGFFF